MKEETSNDPHRCAECGSTNLHVTAWIELNTGELVDCDSPTDAVWCVDCEQETKTK